MMSKNLIFVLNDQDFKTPFDVKLLYRLGNTISQKIFSGKYYVQSQVSCESFQTFLDYLNDQEDNPELTVNNYYEFLLLSEEFNGNLKEYLSKEEFEKIKILSILKNARTEENRDISFCEEYISRNLDYFLEFYSKEMSEMKTTTLYNIFQHEKRQLKNHERAYQFIKELIENGKESNCVLLKSLDGFQMSEKSMKESFSKKEEFCGFVPEFNLSFISDIKNQINSIMNQQIQMMNVFNSVINEKINLIQNNYSLLAQKIDESNEKVDKIIIENDKINNGIQNLQQKVGNIESEMKNKILNDEKKAESNIDKLITENNQTNNKIENISQKIKEINGKIDKIIEESGNKNHSQKVESNLEQIIEGNGKTNEKIVNLSQKIEESNNEIKNLSQKSFEMLKISINVHNGEFNGIIRQLTNQYGGNVSDKGIVNITRSSTWTGDPRDIVNLENTEIFGTNSIQDSWIKYDFKNKKVYPVCYKIRSCNCGKNWAHPKSWVVEGSNTDSQNDWKVLDSRKDCPSLNNPSTVQCFTIQHPSDFYSFLRIRQTDKAWNNTDNLCISSLEYFGFIH